MVRRAFNRVLFALAKQLYQFAIHHRSSHNCIHRISRPYQPPSLTVVSQVQELLRKLYINQCSIRIIYNLRLRDVDGITVVVVIVIAVRPSCPCGIVDGLAPHCC